MRGVDLARALGPAIEPRLEAGHRGAIVVAALDELRRVGSNRLRPRRNRLRPLRRHSSGGAMRTDSGVRPSMRP